ncbi:hypothetical protein V8E36_000672 [Tilletia maclaganii]
MASGGPVGNKVFAPIIFFIAFREALEAALVIGILLGMLESLVGEVRPSPATQKQTAVSPSQERRIMIKRLRNMVFLGAFSGLFIAFCIGAAFLAVFYTQANDLWGKSEELWEGIFNLIAVCLITPMALAILRADRSRAKWSKKLDKAFRDTQPVDGQHHSQGSSGSINGSSSAEDDKVAVAEQGGQPQQSLASHAQPKKQGIVTRVKNLITGCSLVGSNKAAWAVFLIPFVTTLREGLEGVVFIGGVSLGLPATSIPLPAIVGLFCGFLCGYLVFRGGSFSKIKFILVLSTAFLLIIAAGMAARAVYALEFYKYVQLVGDGAAESGSGPGSYYWKTYVWHFNCCNPEDKTTNSGGAWSLLNTLVGWNNTATVGSILMYVFYWLAIVAYLVYATWSEGRLRLALPSTSKKSGGSGRVFWESGKAKARRERIEERKAQQHGPAAGLRVDA